MTQFSLDMENVFEGGVKDGVYEAVISSMKEDATKGGTEYTAVNLVIRNDIEQAHKNQYVFHKIWKAKATGKYNMTFFNTIGKAANLQKGKQYSSLEELFNDFIGKPVKIRVKNETSEYNGNTYENLNVKEFRETEFPNVQHKFKKEEQSENIFKDVGDNKQTDNDDLPF